MNGMERLLQDDLNCLIDRMAATAREGTLASCAQRRPDLLARLGDVEARLSASRAALLQGYGAWRDALGEYGDLWALAVLAQEALPVGELRAA